MSRYYCPFCSSGGQFQKTCSDGVLICGLCGDRLIKKRLFNSKGIIGIITTTTFFLPLLIMIMFVIEEFAKEKLQNNFESSVELSSYKSWNI